MSESTPSEQLLTRIAQELKSIREDVRKVVNAIAEAESEIPEKMRRFIMYMHDVHDVSYMYEERGHPVPRHITEEMERCDDRYRHLLKELHAEGGTFNKVRREMAGHTDNRWDHTRLLTSQRKDKSDETRTSNDKSNGLD